MSERVKSVNVIDDCECNICGWEEKEKAIQLDFSFCDEYTCGMCICKKCLHALMEKLK